MRPVKKTLLTGKNFGERLRAIRKQTGLSLEKFGVEVGFDQSYLSRLERGLAANPSADFVQQVCDFSEVNPAWLINGEGPPENPYLPTGKETEEDIQFTVAVTLFMEEMTARQIMLSLQKVIRHQAMTEKAKVFWSKILLNWADVKLNLEQKGIESGVPDPAAEGGGRMRAAAQDHVA